MLNLRMTLNDVEIPNGHILDSLTFETSMTSQDFTIGDFLFTTVKTKFLNDTVVNYGDIIKIYIIDEENGIEYPYGIYKPYDIKKNQFAREIEFYPALIIKLMRPYQPLFRANYTTRSLLIEMMMELGFNVKELENVLSIDMEGTQEEWGKARTGMEYLQYIASLIGKNVLVNRNGEIEFKLQRETDFILNKPQITKLEEGVENTYFISGIKIIGDNTSNDVIEIGVQNPSDGAIRVTQIHNPFVKSETVARSMYNVLARLQGYQAFKIKYFDFPVYLDVLDVVYVENDNPYELELENNTGEELEYEDGIDILLEQDGKSEYHHPVPIMKLKLSFSRGGLVAELESTLANLNSKQSVSTGSITSRLDIINNISRELNTKVEILDGNILSVITQTDVLTNRLNSLEAGKTYSVILSNEYQNIPIDSNSYPVENKTYSTTVQVYDGGTPVAFTIGTINSANGITVTKTTNTVSFTVSKTTALSSKSGSFDIPIILSDNNKTITKTFSWSATKDGNDAKMLTLSATSQVIRSNDGGKTYSPSQVIVTANCQNTEPNKWYVSVDGGLTFGEKTDKRGSSSYTFNLNSFTSNKTDVLVVKCVATDTSVFDIITLQKLVDVTDIQDDIQQIVDRQSSIQQDLDSITSRVGRTETNINNTNNNIVNNYYTKTETNTQIEQTATQISQTVASQEIGKITVGARNFILKSNVETLVESLTTTDHKFYTWNLSSQTPYINEVNKGDTQTFTLQVWFSGNASNPFTRIKIGENPVHQIMFTDCTVTQVDTDMYKAIGRFTVNKDTMLGNDYTIAIVCDGTLGCSSTIKYLQLEEGSVATSYQQSLEDVMEDFDIKIDETIENIVNGNQEIQSLVQSIISDDFISDSERADLVLIYKEITAQYDNIMQEITDYGDENKNYFSTFTDDLSASYTAFSDALSVVLNNNDTSGRVALQELLATYYDDYHQLLYVISQFVKSERERLESEIIQTNTSITNVITRVDNEVNERKKFMRFSEDGLELFTAINGQVGAFKVLLSENRLSFYENGAEVAYMSNNKLFISNAEITTSLQIGNVVGRKSSNEGFVFNEVK